MAGVQCSDCFYEKAVQEYRLRSWLFEQRRDCGRNQPKVTALLERYKEWRIEFETLRLQGVDGSNERREALENEAAAILDNIQRIKEEREATAEAAQAKAQASRESEQAAQAAAREEALYNVQLNKVNAALISAKKNLESWTSAKTGKSSGSYLELEDEVANLEKLKQNYSTLVTLLMILTAGLAHQVRISKCL